MREGTRATIEHFAYIGVSVAMALTEHAAVAGSLTAARQTGATAEPPPIASCGVDAAEKRVTLRDEVQSQLEQYATTPTSQGASRQVGPQASWYTGDFRRIVDPFASAVSE